MDEKIEKKLVERVKSGDSQAFEKLILNYEKKIYNICLRMSNDEQDAYDLAQEVCMKIWVNLKKFEGNSKLSTWIYRVTMNHCLDHIRKNKNKNETSLYQTTAGSEEEKILSLPSKEKSLETQMEDIELQSVLKTAVSELKDDYQSIIVLRDIEDYSYEEIGDILEISLGTVKSRLSRARQALKKVLTQDKEPYKTFFRQINKKEGR